MLNGDLHALGIVLITGLSLAALVFASSKPKDGEDWLKRSFLPIFALLIFCWQLESRDAGRTWSLQLVLPFVACIAVGFAVKSALVRVPLIVIQMVVGVVIVTQYEHVNQRFWVHGAVAERVAALQTGQSTALLVGATRAIRKAPRHIATRKFPPGWLSAPIYRPLIASWATQPRWDELERVDVRGVWHSWFTNLWPVRHIRVGVWYPGGLPMEAIKGLSVRPLGSSL